MRAMPYAFGQMTGAFQRQPTPPPGRAHRRASHPDGQQARDALVFNDMRGGVLRNSNWRARVFEAAVDACQKSDESFPSITPHDLRHQVASLAVRAGANVKAVQRMLVHAKASMTLDVYADLFDEDLDTVAANLDAAIRSAAYRLRTDQSQDQG
jgi:integrase